MKPEPRIAQVELVGQARCGNRATGWRLGVGDPLQQLP